MILTANKIKTIVELAKIIAEEKKQGKTVALCHGVFDVIHPGHIIHFNDARKLADILVVTITPDRFVHKGPGHPYFNEELRKTHLAALEFIDYVAVNEWPVATETILQLKPNFYVKGGDYKVAGDDLTGKISEEQQAIERVGGEVIFTEGQTFSSSNLINNFFRVYTPETETYLRKMRDQHSAGEIINHLQNLQNLNVLVVGEAIIDEYCYSIPIGMSPKEGIIVSQYKSEERFAGGALAIANHIAGFCKAVTLITSFREDCPHFEFAKSKLRKNVKLVPIFTKERSTIVKKRFIEPSFMRKMFEIQYLDDTPFSGQNENALQAAIKKETAAHDFVVISDYGHGLLTDSVRDNLSKSGKFLAVNAQTNSANIGFNLITKYPHSDFICIDELELKLASGTQYGDFRRTAAEIYKKLLAKKIVVTRGHHGSLLLTGESTVVETPGLSTKVIDRVGAGDAVFAVLSPCVFKGIPDDLIGLIGNCTGALKVGTVCNREPIDPVLLYKFITALLK